jgi:hypothetical protein
MKVQLGMALAAALVFACSSGSKSTRTAANDTGTTQAGSISGTQGTAAGANGTQGTATTDSTGTTNQPNSGTVATAPSDNSQGSMSGSASAQGTTPPTSGSSGTPGTVSSSGSSGSTYGSAGTTAAGGSVSGSSSDNSNLKTVTGSVAKVDENSITLDQSAGGMTLTVDSQTQIVRRGQPVSSGVTSIREGEQVRASFDPASNRADKIEVMGKEKLKHHKSAVDAPPANPDGK